MSIVTLQFGQCGNQLGHSLFNTIMDETKDMGHKHRDIFFREGHQSVPTARAVLVDMEPKVNIYL